MSKLTEVYIDTKDDVYYFSENQIEDFYKFLKESSKDIISIQITEVMTKEEFERMHHDLAQSS